MCKASPLGAAPDLMSSTESLSDLEQMNTFTVLFQKLTLELLEETRAKMSSLQGSGMTEFQARNKSLFHLGRTAALTYIISVAVKRYVGKIEY